MTAHQGRQYFSQAKRLRLRVKCIRMFQCIGTFVGWSGVALMCSLPVLATSFAATDMPYQWTAYDEQCKLAGERRYGKSFPEFNLHITIESLKPQCIDNVLSCVVAFSGSGYDGRSPNSKIFKVGCSNTVDNALIVKTP